MAEKAYPYLPRNYTFMEPEQSARLEHILGHISVGVAILECANQRFRYANQSLISLLGEPWRSQGITSQLLNEVLPQEISKAAQPILQHVCSTGQPMTFPELPYEGFLQARGRTYWRVSIEPAPDFSSQIRVPDENQAETAVRENELLITIEDVTNSARSRLYLEAIHHISSAIAGPFALPLVLDRILQAVQELVGSTRCAVLLIDYSISGDEFRVQDFEEHLYIETSKELSPDSRVTVAAQKGLHLSSQDWHPRLSEQVLLGQIVRNRHTLIITDTSTEPEIELPLLNDNGMPRRPGSVLCVPIFEPTADRSEIEDFAYKERHSIQSHAGSVLGSIEVYHRRARGFPAEEVELLEQFAQQAGLAIQNARFFLRINRLAREQAAARERIEVEVIARTTELAQRNEALLLAQAAQELEGARLQLLLERLPSGVMLISAEDNRISVINHQAAQLLKRLGWVGSGRLLGLSANTSNKVTTSNLLEQDVSSSYEELEKIAQSAIGMNIEELFRFIPFFNASGSAISYEEQPLFLALHKGEASEAELHVTQPDRQMLYLLVNAAPLRSSDGFISNVVLVWHDITKLKALERAREDFFTTMAHELKTPLANIRAHLSALLAEDLRWSPEEQKTFLETADEQVDRLVGMINHFLDASRVEAGALRLELEPVLLPEMFEDLQDRLEALISSSNRKLEIKVAPDVPAVLADYELIMGVLSNLLSNAFRYAPEGDTVFLEAEVLFEANSDSSSRLTGIEIRVIDRGPGISEERQAELFTRFSTFAAQRRPSPDSPGQPESEKHQESVRWSPATGLGLYISRGIIEAHGSKLRLHSVPGQGATFAFTLAVSSEMKRRDH